VVRACVRRAVAEGRADVLEALLPLALGGEAEAAVASGLLALGAAVPAGACLDQVCEQVLARVAGGDAEVWDLCALLCPGPEPVALGSAAGAAAAGTWADEALSHPAFVDRDPGHAPPPELAGAELAEAAQALAPIPRMSLARVAGKPGEADVLRAHRLVFLATVHLAPAVRPGLAAEAWRASFGLFHELSVWHQSSGEPYSELARRVAAACELLLRRRGLDWAAELAEPARLSSLLQASAGPPSPAPAPEQSVLGLVLAMARLPGLAALADAAQALARDTARRLQALARVQAHVPPDLCAWLAARGVRSLGRRRVAAAGPQARRAVVAALNGAVAAVLRAGGGEACVEAGLACVREFGLGAPCADLAMDEVLRRCDLAGVQAAGASGALTAGASLASATAASIAGLSKTPGQQWEAPPAAGAGSALGLGTHGMHAGVFYFELSAPDGDVAAVVGVASRRGPASAPRLAAGATCVVGRLSGGVGVLVDLDAGVLTLHGCAAPRASHPQASVLLGEERFRARLPAVRPLYPALRVLAGCWAADAAVVRPLPEVRTVFCDNAAEQVRNLPARPGGRRACSLLGPLASAPPWSTAQDPIEQCPLLFGAGQNALGELGTGDAKHRRRPAECTALPPDLFPVQVVAGNEFSAVLTAAGQVFAWGMNDHGSCGQGGSGSGAAA
jgi:hypothetical protein